VPHPNPSPPSGVLRTKEKGLKKEKHISLIVKVLSFGEDLGEAYEHET